jgi:hypothetical protein
MVMLDMGGGGEADAVLFGIVRFEPGGGRRVRDTVITFDSPAAADLFAIEQGWSDEYEVCPLRFFVHELRPPTGARMNLDAVLGRVAESRRHRP